MSRRYRSDDGMVTVWTVVMVLACMAMVGLVLDGGVILRVICPFVCCYQTRARMAAAGLAGASAKS